MSDFKIHPEKSPSPSLYPSSFPKEPSIALEPSKTEMEEEGKKVVNPYVSPYYQDTLDQAKPLSERADYEVAAATSPSGGTAARQILSSLLQDAETVDKKEDVHTPNPPSEEDRRRFQELTDAFTEEARASIAEGSTEVTQLLHNVFKLLYEFDNENFEYTLEKTQKQRKEQKKLNEKRSQKMQELLVQYKSTKTWQNIDAAAKAFQLAALAAGFHSTWGIAAFLLALGVAADQVSDDWMKKRVAAFLAGKNKKSNEWWLNFFRVGAGVVTTTATVTGLVMGNRQQLGQALQGYLKVMEATFGFTATSGRGYSEYTYNEIFKEMTHMIKKVEDQNRKVKGSMEDLKKILEHLYTDQRSLFELGRKQAETTQAIFQ